MNKTNSAPENALRIGYERMPRLNTEEGYCLNTKCLETKPENAFILGHCEKCNQMTNHSYDRETGDYICRKCKPENAYYCKHGRRAK